MTDDADRNVPDREPEHSESHPYREVRAAKNNDGEIDPTKVDVDPALFGEVPEGEIDQDIDTWERQVTLIKLTRSCPLCDGYVDRAEIDDMDGNTVIDFMCEDCEYQWLARK